MCREQGAGLRRMRSQGGREDYITRSFMIFLAKNYSGDQIKKNEMSGAYSKYGGEERCTQNFGGHN